MARKRKGRRRSGATSWEQEAAGATPMTDRPALPGAPMTAGSLLALQRTAGNAATAQLVAEATVQRVGWPADLPGRKFVMSAGQGRASEAPRLQSFVQHRTPQPHTKYASQAVNDATADKGKNSGHYQGYHVLHASAGAKSGGSCTVFFIRHEDVVSLLAIGSHAGPSSYEVHWSEAGDKYPVGRTTGPSGEV
jgi:hypothetical protein